MSDFWFVCLFVSFLPSVSAAFNGAVKNSCCIFLMRFPLSRIPQILMYSPTSFICIWGSYQWKDTISERGSIHLFSFSDTNVSIVAAFLSWACKFFTGLFLKCWFSGYPVLPCIFLGNQVTVPCPIYAPVSPFPWSSLHWYLHVIAVQSHQRLSVICTTNSGRQGIPWVMWCVQAIW